MDLFLKIVGGLAIAAVLIVLVFLLLLRLFFRRAAREMANRTPSTLDLKVDPDPKWTAAKSVQGIIGDLERCGYVQGHAYSVEGMAGVSLLSFHHPTAGARACIYDHPSVGNWTDLCADFESGIEYTISNAPGGDQIDTRPGTEKMFAAGSSVIALHERLLRRSAGETPKPVSAEDFQEVFRSAYARDMEWRNSKEGVSEEEFMRIARDNGKEFTEEQLKEAFTETKLQEICCWSDEAYQAFQASTTLSVAEWKKYESNILVFRETFHPAAYLKYLASLVPFEEGKEADYSAALEGGLTLRGLLSRITADSGHEFVTIGEVAQPMKMEMIGWIDSGKSDSD